ncbi:MAG: heat-inducible transcriptional repressor HrcA [Actinomycetota bacterium]|nr:heat-inducible transcriptional repressor HrcA [Actinomycetota bacterium]
MPDTQDLDPRKAAILEAVVTEYIGTAQPVGSHHVAQAAGINVSSATIRSEMVALEREGYLAQPHTSAGRIPTDKGYRFFVDQLTEPGVLSPSQRHKVSRFFDQVHGEMEEMLERTSGLLCELTSYASVVLPPSHEAAAVRSVQLVGLGPRLALLVAVLADGTVEKRSIDFAEEVSDEVLATASARLQAAAKSRSLGAVIAPEPSGDPAVDKVVSLAQPVLADLASEAHDRVFVGGPSKLAAAFDAVDTVRAVLATLEKQLVVVSLLRDVIERGLSVAIGAEHGYEPLSSCAVVVTPVNVDGHAAGAVGLLGPTRMNYPQALAAARVVSEHLGRRLGESFDPGSARRPAGRAAPRRRARGRR